jgi:imidazolonepropionase-like amidohydrolase
MKSLRVAGIVLALGLALQTPVRSQPSSDPLARYLKHEGTTFVLENARLIDGTGAAARDGVTLIVEDGRITYLGAARRSLPPRAERIDLTGHTILPGLIMMHEHINYFSGAMVWNAMPGSVPKLLLAAGVTTARTAGSEAPQVDLNLKRRIDGGRVPGPQFFVTGGYLNGPAGGFLGDNAVETADEAAAVTAFWIARGATSIKVYSDLAPAALRGAVDEATRSGMHVAGHLGELSCTQAAQAGIHTIEHGLASCMKDFGIAPDALGRFRYDPSSAEARALVALLVANKTVVVATPAVTEPFERSEEELSMLSPDQRQRHAELIASRPPWLPSIEDQASWNEANRAFERDFVARGGRLLIGGDASDFGLVPGFANHHSMIALARAGFAPLEVIRFATADAARFLGLDRRGTVTTGNFADLLIVKGAPDRDMAAIRDVSIVFKDGRAFDPAKLRAAAKGKLGIN